MRCFVFVSVQQHNTSSAIFYYWLLRLRFTTVYTIKLRSVLYSVVIHAGCNRQDSLMRGGLHGKRMTTAINYCMVDHRDLITLHQSSIGKPDIGRESRFLPTPPAFDASIGGSQLEYYHKVWYGKLEWYGYLMVKKFEDMFTRFVKIHKCDGRTPCDSTDCTHSLTHSLLRLTS